MIDVEAFKKQSKLILGNLRDMENTLSNNMEEMSQMKEAGPVMKKMEDLKIFMKNNDLQGVMRIQKELIAMKDQIEQDGDTADNNE